MLLSSLGCKDSDRYVDVMASYLRKQVARDMSSQDTFSPTVEMQVVTHVQVRLLPEQVKIADKPMATC